MHQICDWAKYHKVTFYVVTFVPMKIRTLSAPQNDRLSLVFVKNISDSVHILIGSKIQGSSAHHLIASERLSEVKVAFFR